MDITSLYYFTELAKDLHMTRTAERLFISQQTLSNHIQRLESYYGTPLFERKPSLRLTCAGEFVLSFAQMVVRENNNLKEVLFDVANQDRGVLKFAASPSRADILVKNTLPAFSQKYPQVQLRVTSAVSAEAERMVLAGDVDLAVVLAGSPDSRLTATSLMREPTYLCVEENLLRQYYGDETDALKQHAARYGAHVQDFARLPFAMMQHRMGKMLHGVFDRHDILPNIQIAATHTSTYVPLCQSGAAACFIQLMMLASLGSLGESINIFPLYDDEKPVTQELVLVRRRDFYLSHYSKYFVDQLTGYFTGLEQIDPTHLAPAPGTKK